MIDPETAPEHPNWRSVGSGGLRQAASECLFGIELVVSLTIAGRFPSAMEHSLDAFNVYFPVSVHLRADLTKPQSSHPMEVGWVVRVS
ncbi:MAG: hypothetical protein CL912_26460 [Deltaproteobacteria bacterium]|nr:hypothetical protein [Deltaproteobacteria bacterium]